jgi:hypothetical protein
VRVGSGVGLPGFFQELTGPLIKFPDRDLLLPKHLFHGVKVRPFPHHLLLGSQGPRLEQGAPFLEALQLCPQLIPLPIEHLLHLA